MFFSKCVPHSIEGLMLGFINSIYSFNVQIVGRLTCLFFLRGQDVTIDNYANLSKCYYSAWWLQFATILLLPFLVNRNEYYSLQAIIAKVDNMTPEEIK